MKKLLITSAALVWAFGAFAQVAAPPEVTIKVTAEELNIISDGLQTQPFGKVVPLMNKLRAQIAAQQAPPVEEPKKE